MFGILISTFRDQFLNSLLTTSTLEVNYSSVRHKNNTILISNEIVIIYEKSSIDILFSPKLRFLALIIANHFIDKDPSLEITEYATMLFLSPIGKNVDPSLYDILPYFGIHFKYVPFISSYVWFNTDPMFNKPFTNQFTIENIIPIALVLISIKSSYIWINFFLFRTSLYLLISIALNKFSTTAKIIVICELFGLIYFKEAWILSVLLCIFWKWDFFFPLTILIRLHLIDPELFILSFRKEFHTDLYYLDRDENCPVWVYITLIPYSIIRIIRDVNTMFQISINKSI